MTLISSGKEIRPRADFYCLQSRNRRVYWTQEVNMKMTRWMKPIADCGGITSMIQAEVRKQWACAEQKDYRVNIVVHAYREIGSSLEAVVEVQILKGPFGPFIKMGTLVV